MTSLNILGVSEKNPAADGNGNNSAYLHKSVRVRIFFHPDFNRRCLNYTGSAGKRLFADYTAGGEFHSAPKTTYIYYSPQYGFVNI